MKKYKVGIIGCGKISDIYLKNCTQEFSTVLEVVACSDIIPENARAKAAEYNIPKACSNEELLADPEISIIINLTNPPSHFDVNVAALNSGKHVYCEKPLAVTREQGRKTLELAKEKGLLVGCAPDTILGGGLQTCRKLIDDGWIGKPVAANGMILMRSPAEGFHPNAEFFMKEGGEALFDMGPYFVTGLVALLGPVRRVTASALIPYPERRFTNKQSPRYGEKIKMDVPSTTCAVMDFTSGPAATLIVTKDCFGYIPRFEIYGTEGILYANDPNMFEGPVFVQRRDGEKKEMPLTHGFADNKRGAGVADMAYSLIHGRPHRASGELACHVLDIMHGFYDASREGRHIEITSGVDRPVPLAPGLAENVLDE